MKVLQSGLAAIAAMAFAFSASAKPVNHRMQTEIDELITAYTQHFNDHNVPGVTALFTADAVIVASTAPSIPVSVNSGQPAITTYLQGQFHDGSHLDSFTENQVSEVRRNVVIMVGQFRQTGSSPGGHYDLLGTWTAVGVRFAHHWRFRLLTVFPSPPTGQG